MIGLEQIERVFQVGEETVYALQEVNLTIQPGEYVSIMGPSGSGKSTLLNILGLLDRPDQGVYRLEGMDTTELGERKQANVRRHKIGFIFQFFNLIPTLTAKENVEVPMMGHSGIRERRNRSKELLELVGQLRQPCVHLIDAHPGHFGRDGLVRSANRVGRVAVIAN